MNTKRVWLAAILSLLILIWAGTALAATDKLDFKMELNASEFFEPKTITVSLTVTNVSGSDMPGPVKLYYPDGVQVEEFGEPVLNAGASKNWTGTWDVTKDELVAGKISFRVVYTDYDDNGELKESVLAISKHIQYKGGEPAIEVNRTILPSVAEEGQTVSIIYEITNTGASDITGLTIQENAAGKDREAVGGIKSGETAKHTFTVKMKKKDLTSQATVTYKSGGKTYTSKVDPATIKFGKVNLTATLSADRKGGAPGDTVKLTLKLKNSGTTDFTDVLVTDEKLGIVFSDQTVKAGETVTLEKDLTITETQDLLFTVRGNNGAGGEVETATGKVSITATDPNRQILLEVEAVPDRNEVYQIPGGIVRFTVTVTNKSAMDVENVVVKAVDATMYTFEKIPAGESRYFSREAEISMPGIFQFTANVKDQLGETLSFTSNEMEITLTSEPAEPTPTPVVLPTQPPEITPPPQPAEITVPPEPETTAGTEEENARARQEWEAQVAAIEQQNQQAQADWEAQVAETERQNQQAIADWEAEKDRILNATPAPKDRSTWPEAKADGWDTVDLTDYPLENVTQETKTRAEVMNNGLLLINAWHSRPLDFDESGIQTYSQYTAVKKKIQVDTHNIAMFPAAWDALLEAITAAKEENLEYYIVSEGYRTWDYQNDLFQKRKDKLAAKYSNEEDLIAATKKEVNYPGTSEFNSGLAFTLRLYKKGDSDINSAKYSTTQQGIWMNENSWKYGLIFRFPEAEWPLPSMQDKSFITGVSVKLNLYRYVGKGNAAAMHCLDMCLEEYVAYLHDHPHIAVFENGELKYEIYCQYVGDAESFALDLTPATSYVASLDNMGYVITVFEH